jgi:RHS repeat-associated protein
MDLDKMRKHKSRYIFHSCLRNHYAGHHSLLLKRRTYRGIQRCASLTPITVQRSYDSAGRLSATNFASFGYDSSGNVSSITEQVWRPSTLSSGTGIATSTVAWSVSYDALNRLTQLQANSATPASLLAPTLGAQRSVFGFDANGSRLSEARYTTSGSPTAVLSVLTRSPQLEPSSNRLLGFNQSVAVGTQTASTVVPYALNAAGDITQSGLLRHFYNPRGRLNSVTAGSDDLSPTTRYAYNLLGQRVFKTQALIPPAPGDESDPAFFASLLSFFAQPWNPTASNPQAAQESIGTLYLYGHEGYLGESTLLGEYSNATGSPSGQHIYLQTPQGPLPVMTILNGTRYAVMADHLHTPRRLQQTNLITNWQWAYSAFGEEPPTQRKYRFANPNTFPNLGETTTANALNFNLRYPGQVADAESNLFYNHYRTYDPKQGRYTQSDPIGLSGGWNRFAYVEGNAFRFTDPKGLQILPRPVTPVMPIPGMPRPRPIDPTDPSGPTYTPRPTLPNWLTNLFCKDDTSREECKQGCVAQYERDAAECRVAYSFWGSKGYGACMTRAGDYLARCTKQCDGK